MHIDNINSFKMNLKIKKEIDILNITKKILRYMSFLRVSDLFPIPSKYPSPLKEIDLYSLCNKKIVEFFHP